MISVALLKGWAWHLCFMTSDQLMILCPDVFCFMISGKIIILVVPIRDGHFKQK